MRVRDLKPLLYPRDRSDRFEGDIIARCNQLLAIVQQMEREPLREPPKIRRPMPDDEMGMALRMIADDIEACMDWIAEAVSSVRHAPPVVSKERD